MDESGPSNGELRIMAAMWAEVVRQQTRRFEDAVEDLDSWRADRAFRTAYWSNPSAAWRPHFDEANSMMTQSEIWMVGADRYFLLSALAQLRKCVVALPDDNLPTVRDQRIIRLLRDIDEHWEQPVGTGRSLTELRITRPDVGPGQIASDGKRVWVGKVTTTELLTWAEEVDQAVRNRAEAAGNPIPPSDQRL
jgi:hypothetical protein